MLIALSSGAVARIDDDTGEVRVLGYATPLANALADGFAPGDAVYADATGVVVLPRGGGALRVLEAPGSGVWEDLSTAGDGSTMLLASAERIAVLDVARREIVGAVPLEGFSRLLPWDEEGSVLAWSYDREGPAEGQVLPRGAALVRRIATEVSNLRVHDGKLSLR